MATFFHGTRTITWPRAWEKRNFYAVAPVGPARGKCQGGDSNPYGFLHQILSLARLPIPPPWQLVVDMTLIFDPRLEQKVVVDT